MTVTTDSSNNNNNAAPLPASTAALLDLARLRRSIYTLSPTSPIPDAQLRQLVEHAVTHMPSGFNTQSSRVVLLLHDEHKKLWRGVVRGIFEGMVERGEVPREVWEGQTRGKLESFERGYGTILFFEDPTHIAPMSEKFPIYKDGFPQWAQHTNAIHQYFLWLALHSVGLGANLQHYNPLIDEAVIKSWSLPTHWKLTAQMVFGTPAAEAGEKTFKPLEERVKVFGAQ
ncbi:hypothetical protein AJ80_03058 [Polytolypa hystricis UAMH7299]|uniref:Nitroreductase domain-containing protein n=1 Tax=Polytolypa hystricis (strain UAMH7299) TaxID=1447883 RepID=A0A2B7YJX5_POLH7|nr:hypothetical protein AJ80_03058 [Polytolypa hystricis UAMH7299]